MMGVAVARLDPMMDGGNLSVHSNGWITYAVGFLGVAAYMGGLMLILHRRRLRRQVSLSEWTSLGDFVREQSVTEAVDRLAARIAHASDTINRRGTHESTDES